MKTDWFHDAAEPAFLFFNPFDQNRTVSFDTGTKPRDLSDRVSGHFLKRCAFWRDNSA